MAAVIAYQSKHTDFAAIGPQVSVVVKKVKPMIALTRTTKSLILAAALLLPASYAAALTPLNEEQHINHSLISAGVGDLIRRNCSSISARIFVVFRKTNDLERYALDLGYTKAEISAFLDSKVEQARVRKATNDYLASNGVVKGSEATYCALGRAEIAKKSLTGQLLRSR